MCVCMCLVSIVPSEENVSIPYQFQYWQAFFSTIACLLHGEDLCVCEVRPFLTPAFDKQRLAILIPLWVNFGYHFSCPYMTSVVE